MDHAKDNMAFSVDVNCQPNDATEPASIANQKDSIHLIIRIA